MTKQNTNTSGRQSAFLIVDSDNKTSTYKVPIWVYEVNSTDLFPVKYEYKQRGYKGLRFSERLNRIEF